MPVQVHWDDPEHTILRYTFEGKWTWGEVLPAIRQANQMIEEAACVTPALVDVRQSDGFPHETSLRNLRYIISQIPPNLGTVVIVDYRHSRQVSIFQSLLGLVSKIYRVHWKFNYTTSMSEAYSLIAANGKSQQVPPAQEH